MTAIIDKLKTQRIEEEIKTSNLINILEVRKEEINRCLSAFEKALPTIEKTLNKLHLSINIERVVYSLCGPNSYNSNLYSQEAWVKGKNGICITLNSDTNEKFKFVEDRGYDRNGGGKNNKQLSAREEKLVNILNSCVEKFQINSTRFSFTVNKYSFEKNNKYPNKNIIIELYIY